MKCQDIIEIIPNTKIYAHKRLIAIENQYYNSIVEK